MAYKNRKHDKNETNEYNHFASCSTYTCNGRHWRHRLLSRLNCASSPVDRRLRAVDSVAIQRAVDRDLELDLSSDVYNTWVTNRAHPYKQEDVPESYRIDLRGFHMPTLHATSPHALAIALPLNASTKVLTLKFALATPLLPPSMAKCALYVTTLEDMATT